MPELDRIEVNPRVMLGKPVIRGTRIPVELLLRKLDEGATVEVLLDAYPRLSRGHPGAAPSSRLGVAAEDEMTAMKSSFFLILLMLLVASPLAAGFKTTVTAAENFKDGVGRGPDRGSSPPWGRAGSRSPGARG